MALTQWRSLKWPTFYRRHCEMYFHNKTFVLFDWNVTEMCSFRSNWQVTIGACNNLALDITGDKTYLNQGWSSSVTPYVITRPQWEKEETRCMTTSSNGNIFCVTGPFVGNSPVTGEFPSQRPVTRSFDVLFDLNLNKRSSKQSWRLWFKTS